MRDRAISIADLNPLRLWIESRPDVPEGDWYKDFGSSKTCGHGSYPTMFQASRASSERQGHLPRELPGWAPTARDGGCEGHIHESTTRTKPLARRTLRVA